MRKDVSVLLGRIGHVTFNYHDFGDDSLETDIWPIFEALLLDEQVVGEVDTKMFARVALEPGDDELPHVATAPASRPAASPVTRREAAAAGIFEHYGARRGEGGGESVRDMLARLAGNTA